MSRGETAQPLLEPRDDLESAILHDPDVAAGLTFGEPRSGHPEGAVGAHVAELWSIIDTISDLLSVREVRRLRLLSLLHDIGKSVPRSPGRPHHGISSRRVAERFVDDPPLLEIIELHDEPYRLWKRERRTGAPVWEPLVAVFSRVYDAFDLFVLFCTVDGSTGDKDPAPRLWLHDHARRYAPDHTCWEAPARAVAAKRPPGSIGPHRDLPA